MRKRRKMSVNYASATSGTKAHEEIKKVLRSLGCDSVGIMEHHHTHEVSLAFTHRGRNVQLRVSAGGWATMWLKKNPYSHRIRRSRIEYEQDALQQGCIAINSILRDWVKGQVTAIECGLLSFEAAFLPHMLTHDGRPLHERVNEFNELLPEADPPKVVALPGRGQ